MSDTPIDNGAAGAPQSTPVAPPSAGEPPVSTPAPADTAANGQAEPKAPEPDKQSRRDSRAFATYRRENRELARQLGSLEAQLAALRQGQQGSQPDAGQQPPQQERHSAQVAAERAFAEHATSVRERLEDAGEEIEGFDKVMHTITSDSFPINRVMLDFLGETEKPAQMAQWLADNPSEARRISLLSEAVALRALERAEARIGAKPAPRTTNTPPPPPTVNGRSTPQFDPNKASMEEYAEHWKAQRAKAGIR